MLGSRSIYLAWEAPKQFYRTIDHYYIEVRDTSTNLKQRRALENNEREVSFNSYVNKHRVKCHDCRFQSIYLQRFFILSAVDLKRNQSCKGHSYMQIWLMHLYILSVLSLENTCIRLSVYGSECVYVMNKCISNNVLWICYVLLQTIVTGLPTNAGYSLHIAGVTKSLHSNMHYIGEFSKPWTFILSGKKDSL